MEKSISETGHYKNVANFSLLIKYITTLPRYNPARSALQPSALNAQHLACDATMKGLSQAEVAETAAITARYVPFLALPAQSTRIVSEFESLVPGSNVLGLARTLQAKMNGTRIGKDTAAAVPDAGKTEDAAAGEGKSISVSQRSFDAMLSHYEKLIQVLEQEPGYTSNTNELTIPGLRAHLAHLKALNDTAATATLNAVRMRARRQEDLYTPVVGLVPIAKSVKMAVLAVYKASSPEYKKAAAIPFRTLTK